MASTKDLVALVGEGGSKPSDSYNGENLLKGYETLQALGGLDVSREGERKSLLEIMAGAEDTAKKELGAAFKPDAPEALQLYGIFQRAYLSNGERILDSYVDKHFKNLAGELTKDKETLPVALQLAFSYTPQKSSSDAGYEAARKAVSDAKVRAENSSKALKSLQEKGKDETGYLAKSLDTVGDKVLQSWLQSGSIAGEWLAWKGMVAQRTAVRTIETFGADKYLVGSRAVIMPQVEAANKMIGESKDRAKTTKEALEKNPDARLGKITEEVRDTALEIIGERKNKKKEEPKKD